jgi:hypothetical protein
MQKRATPGRFVSEPDLPDQFTWRGKPWFEVQTTDHQKALIYFESQPQAEKATTAGGYLASTSKIRMLMGSTISVSGSSKAMPSMPRSQTMTDWRCDMSIPNATNKQVRSIYPEILREDFLST